MYKTTNEMNHFIFEEAYIDEMRMNLDTFCIKLENVKILPENSCNRDIRLMRTNDLSLKLYNAEIRSVIEEGYKRFDADGKLIEQIGDKEINKANYTDLFKEFEGCTIYSIEQNNDEYIIVLDAPEHIYDICIKADNDIEEWERFINI